MKTCPVCGRTFPERGDQRYCGTPCRLKAMAERNRSDPEAQRTRGRMGGRVRGEQLRAAAAGLGYLKENGQHVHRTVAALVLGRPLLPEEVVHHEDKNKMNNDPANLIVFRDQGQHARHHKLNHLGASMCDCDGVRLKEVM